MQRHSAPAPHRRGATCSESRRYAGRRIHRRRARTLQSDAPTVYARFGLGGMAGAPHIAAYKTLRQAVLNLLNNAADASPRSVECAAHCTERDLVLDIRDRCTGFEMASEALLEASPPHGATDGLSTG